MLDNLSLFGYSKFIIGMNDVEIPFSGIIKFCILFLVIYILARLLYAYQRPKLRAKYPFYTYILECSYSLNESKPDYYVGHTYNFYNRLKKHKNKKINSTKYYKYIRPIYVEGHTLRKYAKEKEMMYKDYSSEKKMNMELFNYNLLNSNRYIKFNKFLIKIGKMIFGSRK